MTVLRRDYSVGVRLGELVLLGGHDELQCLGDLAAIGLSPGLQFAGLTDVFHQVAVVSAGRE